MIDTLLNAQGFMVLDGGLATQLESRGHTLDPRLWSAALLHENPEAIRQVHLDNLRAGADCVITASYQASISGFEMVGLSRAEGERLLQVSVELALSARDEHARERARSSGRPHPLVAASIGPFAAFRADGSEYTGANYPPESELVSFHAERFAILAATEADLLACETVPTASEARALAQLLAEIPGRRAWISFCCRDARSLSDGTPLRVAAAPLDQSDQVVAIGVNCTAPEHIPGLLRELRTVTDKPLVVYPNSGESFDPRGKTWCGSSSSAAFGQSACAWFRLGAALIGGCCRTEAAHVRAVREALLKELANPPASADSAPSA